VLKCTYSQIFLSNSLQTFVVYLFYYRHKFDNLNSLNTFDWFIKYWKGIG